MKTILVVGSVRSLNAEARQATLAIGRAIAENGYGLVTGSWRGVDSHTADAFLSALDRAGVPAVGRYTQIYYRRPRWLGAFSPPDRSLRTVVPSGHDAHREAVRRADAAILIGGVGGVRDAAFEMLGSGRPIFPLPLTGGDALAAYARVLERWADQPVPGLTRSQFMSLSLPIGHRADTLVRLLRAALDESIDVFISYRRTDVPGVSGRLAERLSEHLGPKRVFLDAQSIRRGSVFHTRIDEALSQSRVIIAVIGPHWDPGRLASPDDFVRRELESALARGIPVVPLLAFGGRLPDRDVLPPSLQPLLAHQAADIQEETEWEQAMKTLIAEIDAIQRSPRQL